MRTDHLLWEYYQWRSGSKRLFFDFLIRAEMDLQYCGQEIEEIGSLRQYFVELKNTLRQEEGNLLRQVIPLFDRKIMLAYCIFAYYLYQKYDRNSSVNSEANRYISNIHDELWSLKERLAFDDYTDRIIAAVRILCEAEIDLQVLFQKFPEASEFYYELR